MTHLIWFTSLFFEFYKKKNCNLKFHISRENNLEFIFVQNRPALNLTHWDCKTPALSLWILLNDTHARTHRVFTKWLSSCRCFWHHFNHKQQTGHHPGLQYIWSQNEVLGSSEIQITQLMWQPAEGDQRLPAGCAVGNSNIFEKKKLHNVEGGGCRWVSSQVPMIAHFRKHRSRPHSVSTWKDWHVLLDKLVGVRKQSLRASLIQLIKWVAEKPFCSLVWKTWRQCGEKSRRAKWDVTQA